ncbi:hypothetical protein DAPPUDRAFT_262452 [Daphnia pulex]|uniref:Chromo domain-containing protein n=1 Tax=Daphnia pulex TaxID=6669 RepID=E9HN08_DAPPU|nr:hypothetical protein DAPPUDRAFT_262452 [Daphnia pulex]|eukprot:EFX66877.1 hypothetical protein DAPPUDRAFT_262452 [Daphnia pulex]
MDMRQKFVVEKILNIGKCPKGKIWYLVKWQGYKKPTWNYGENCEGCALRIRQFMEDFNYVPVDLIVTKPFLEEHTAVQDATVLVVQVETHPNVQEETVPVFQDETVQVVEDEAFPVVQEAVEAVEGEAVQETPSKDETSEDKTDRGGKRQKDRSSSPANVNKVAEGLPPEDEPEYDGSLWSCLIDLNLTINKTDFVSGAPLTEAGFAYMWAGARANYGIVNGKVCYEVKVTENLAVSHLEESEPNHHVVHVGWSIDSTTYQLGKIKKILLRVPFQLNDVVGVYLDASEEKESVELSFSVNGETQGVAFTLPGEELNGRALFPHILTKNCRFEVNFGQKEEPWFLPTEGYEWPSKIQQKTNETGTEMTEQELEAVIENVNLEEGDVNRVPFHPQYDISYDIMLSWRFSSTMGI